MIVIIVICIIILLTLLNKNEQFVNYKPVTVTPKKIVYDKLTINIPGNNRLYTNISNKIREIYPIKFIEFKNIMFPLLLHHLYHTLLYQFISK